MGMGLFEVNKSKEDKGSRSFPDHRDSDWFCTHHGVIGI